MAERMTLEQIQRAYPNEWVVVTEFEADDSVIVRAGVVVLHTRSRTAAHEAIATVTGPFAIWFVGAPTSNFGSVLGLAK